ncbi:MAG TPA: hypothetical protein DCQ98_22225 [Planctomycetaceae bacterium]|nr:hypothetical protein [Planctomycetaceae bacterium]HRF00486.1 TM1812 family CRISPR-associated protein [Pirellulaceae bacterium]
MRLVSFLGKGDYRETDYRFEEQLYRSRFVLRALADALRPSEIRVIATDEAWAQHGAVLDAELTAAGHPAVIRVPIPTAAEPDDLWQLFGAVVATLRDSQTPILFDITHGFRSQPFFAAACIQYVQTIEPNGKPVRVVYGEYRSGEPSPIWELTTFLDVLAWSRELLLLLRTGRADGIVLPTEALGRELNRTWAASGRVGPRPQIQLLSQALARFGDDLTTIRTGSLLVGDRPTASGLVDAIDRTRGDIERYLPQLAPVIDQVRGLAAPLDTGGERLSTPGGQRALLELARLYRRLGRYGEAVSVLREGWISAGASEACDQPGPTLDFEARHAQERAWIELVPSSRSVAEVRNDLQHAGFKKQPNTREWFDRQLTMLLERWEQAIESTVTTTDSGSSLRPQEQSLALSKEQDFDRLLENALRDSPVFLAWLVDQTKFAGQGAVYDASRSDHPWSLVDLETMDPATGETRIVRRGSETDVLLLLRYPDGRRVALHIENKLEGGRFTPDQPAMYRARAAQWLGDPKYGSYVDFQTILIAPQSFLERHASGAAEFDVRIRTEELLRQLVHREADRSDRTS